MMLAYEDWKAMLGTREDPEIAGILNTAIDIDDKVAVVKGILLIGEMIDISNPQTELETVLKMLINGLVYQLDRVQTRSKNEQHIKNYKLQYSKLL